MVLLASSSWLTSMIMISGVYLHPIAVTWCILSQKCPNLTKNGQYGAKKANNSIKNVFLEVFLLYSIKPGYTSVLKSKIPHNFIVNFAL